MLISNTVGFFLWLLFSCDVVERKAPLMGVLQIETVFNDSYGNPTFWGRVKCWYIDSVVIEEINISHIKEDTKGVLTHNYSVLSYRYLDLKKRLSADYATFSDTAQSQAVKRFSLDSMQDKGWSFYLDKSVVFEERPLVLGDTIINSARYTVAKGKILDPRQPHNSFVLGYWKCSGQPDYLFSLEKQYSREMGCSLMKYAHYGPKASFPFAVTEITNISNTLTEEQIAVFNAWSRNLEKVKL